jgi:hypothetical protein
MTRLIPDKLVALRYSVCLRTLWRWDRDPRLGFPRAVVIRGRKYRKEHELDAFDRARTELGHQTR